MSIRESTKFRQNTAVTLVKIWLSNNWPKYSCEVGQKIVSLNISPQDLRIFWWKIYVKMTKHLLKAKDSVGTCWWNTSCHIKKFKRNPWMFHQLFRFTNFCQLRTNISANDSANYIHWQNFHQFHSGRRCETECIRCGVARVAQSGSGCNAKVASCGKFCSFGYWECEWSMSLCGIFAPSRSRIRRPESNTLLWEINIFFPRKRELVNYQRLPGGPVNTIWRLHAFVADAMTTLNVLFS